MPKPGWEQFEHDVQELLGLDSTVCSGNQWNDPGDAVDRRHPSEGGFRLMVDCKYTEKVSWSFHSKKVGEWFLKATEMGMRGVMAVRFMVEGRPNDYIILSFDDFAELLEKAEENSKPKPRNIPDKPTCPNMGSVCNCTGACLPRQSTPGFSDVDRKWGGWFSDVDRTWHDGRWGG